MFRGVKQGYLIPPTLFAFYINDLSTEIKSLNKGIHIDNINLSMLLHVYTVDIVLLAPKWGEFTMHVKLCKLMVLQIEIT